MSEQDQDTEINIDEQIASRRAKLKVLRAKGQAYSNQFRRDSLALELHQHYAACASEDLEKLTTVFHLAGRIMLRRIMGKASFIHIQDMSGQLQIYVKQDLLPPEIYEHFKEWDMGDIVGVSGTLFKTKTGELTLRANHIELLTKALRPMPDKFHGLADQELRYRQRYVDLIANAETRKVFLTRSKIINFLRQFFQQHGFIEVETPMMHPIAGGATARPFKTFHNTLDRELFLRIAPELYLKRLVVGGFEKVFEINRSFRNEGVSTRHNPEFTMLELYQAYTDYRELMDLTEMLMRQLANEVLGMTIIQYQGMSCDFAKPFKRMTVQEAVLHYNSKLLESDYHDLQKMQAYASSLKIALHGNEPLGKLQIEVFEKTVEQQLIDPTFITEYPVEVSPLARRNDVNPAVVDRFEFYVAGRELANAFSELNDPDDQAARFREQVAAKQAGDQEAMSYDEDYITALEYGMPPTAGEGIGIDRLVMLFTNAASIRDVILFPQLRSK